MMVGFKRRFAPFVEDGSKKEVLVASKLSALFHQPLELSERNGYYNLW